MFDPNIYTLDRDKTTGTATVSYDSRKGTTQGADRIGRHAFHVPAYIVTTGRTDTPRVVSRNPRRFTTSTIVTRTYQARDWT